MADLETNVTPETNETLEQNQPTQEDLLSRIAALEAEMKQKDAQIKKLNIVKDESLKKVGDLTKQVRANMDAEQLAKEAALEAEEARKKIDEEKDLKIARYEARDMFRSMGMDGDLLEKSIEAKLSGDETTVNSNIAKYYELRNAEELKRKEAEWLKNRPPVNAGTNDSNGGVTKEQFDRMGYAARVAFKQKYPDAYTKYTE